MKDLNDCLKRTGKMKTIELRCYCKHCECIFISYCKIEIPSDRHICPICGSNNTEEINAKGKIDK